MPEDISKSAQDPVNVQGRTSRGNDRSGSDQSAPNFSDLKAKVSEDLTPASDAVGETTATVIDKVPGDRRRTEKLRCTPDRGRRRDCVTEICFDESA
ncbi:hypothetical protein [Rhizobium sp. BK377]|jgi:hypothetical protein|uniref:hypothetical protein n=1 Tax=Rhizobium sp. BK377 TaxID=2587058 RepID=UPI00161E239E|nr:hypothetical protein [Rhizobium sp. BK377]MBB3464311.1 hypothetical protein [Rhizobium sp. BK377]